MSEPAAQSDIVVTDVPEAGRYEARIDGDLAGFADRHRSGDVVTMPHTVVRPEFAGRGVGSALVRTALEDISAQGLRVRPTCSFVEAYLDRRPELQHLIAADD